MEEEIQDDASGVAIQTRQRIARRILPFLLLLYIVAFLDRVNVAYAGPEMSHDLGFSDRVSGLSAGIFFDSRRAGPTHNDVRMTQLSGPVIGLHQ